MTLVIPGVEVRVVKEVVTPQLAPSGILGLVGITEIQPGTLGMADSWSRFIELFGASSAYSLPEAGLALGNGVSELVVSAVKPDSGKAATISIPGDGNAAALTITARAPGPWANGLVIKVESRPGIGKTFDLTISRTGEQSALEMYRGLTLKSGDAKFAVDVLTAAGSRIKADIGAGSPADGSYVMAGGGDVTAQAYTDALDALQDDADIDMVLVAIQDFSDPTNVAKIYSAVQSHCERMAVVSKGRLGFGQVPPATGSDPIAAWITLGSELTSDRFVLVAPNGVVGAVAGMIGSLDYFQSPTFKTLTGVTTLSRALKVDEQSKLLGAHVVPVIAQRGRGTIVVRGLTTDGDQISVRRVADRAVRGVKMIGDLFIGRMNNELGRGALKQKLMEFLTQMVRDGALVPSIDGLDPAFKLNVYSSQADFALGNVRVDLAVRPVRAIDYIYATILVQT